MLTAYCNCAQCCGTAGNATASGVMPSAGHTVAMAGVPFGTQLLINGTVYTVEDLGTPYGHVDIYFGSHEEAFKLWAAVCRCISAELKPYRNIMKRLPEMTVSFILYPENSTFCNIFPVNKRFFVRILRV